MTPPDLSESDAGLREKLVGSWDFIRSSKEGAVLGDSIYHFSSDGQHYWEYFLHPDRSGKRILTKANLYRVQNSELILTWPNGREIRHLLQEEAGEIRMTGITGHFWWMSKLPEPTSFMDFFVYPDGMLTKIRT